MLARVVISIFLIVAGIASPWLVRDWCSYEPREGGIYDSLSALSDRVRSYRQEAEWGSFARANQREETESSRDQEPYPFASKAKRMLQGMLPDSIGFSHPSLSSSQSSGSQSKADGIVETTRESMKGELSRLGLAVGNPIFVRLFKEEGELELWMKNPGKPEFTLYKVYRIRHWSGVKGPKLREGDGQAPEGFYFVSPSRLRPDTRHHLGLDLGFPNDYDMAMERTGSGILIHGGETSSGSFALSASDMNEVYTLASLALEAGQPFFRVNAFPFRMTDHRMEKEWKAQPKWIDFWVNLKEGYDFFENVNLPPDVSVEAGEYAFRIY